jgi:hypothetical protein
MTPEDERLRRPRCFAQVVDARPHEVAGDVVVGADELPQLLRIDGRGPAAAHRPKTLPASAPPPGAGRGAAGTAAIVAANAAHPAALRPNHGALRERHRGRCCSTFARGRASGPRSCSPRHRAGRETPAADSDGRLGRNMVAGHGHRPGRVLGVEDAQQPRSVSGPSGRPGREPRCPRSTAPPRDGCGRDG